jgi:hypothetical protein
MLKHTQKLNSCVILSDTDLDRSENDGCREGSPGATVLILYRISFYGRFPANRPKTEKIKYRAGTRFTLQVLAFQAAGFALQSLTQKMKYIIFF